MQKIDERVRELAHQFGDLPTVYAGDFNSITQAPTPGVDSDDHRQGVAGLMHAREMTDSVAIAERKSGADQNSINPTSDDHRFFGPGRQLDHVWVPPEMSVRRWILVNRAVAYADQFSGHDPLVVDLSFSPHSLEAA